MILGGLSQQFPQPHCKGYFSSQCWYKKVNREQVKSNEKMEQQGKEKEWIQINIYVKSTAKYVEGPIIHCLTQVK